MLQQIHDGIKGWVAWLIIIAIIASLGLLGINYYVHDQGGNGNNDIAAKVNGGIISQQQVNLIYQQIRQQQPGAPLTSSNEQELRQTVVQKLVEQALFTQAAKQNNFRISENQLNTVVTQIPEFQENGQFSQARFLAIVNQLGYTPAQFIANVQADLLVNQMQTGITATSFAMPGNVLEAMRLIKQTRDFSYGTVSFKQYVPKITAIDDQQAKQYYQANLEQFQTQERLRLSYLVLSDKNMASQIKPTAAELRQYYQDSISNYTQPAQWQIAHIVISNANNDPSAIQTKLRNIQQAVAAKEDFAKIAKKFSDDPLSANSGGALPWVTASALPPAIQNAITKLKAGEVSAPIPTSDGYEIVKVLAVKKAVVTPFSQVENKIRANYIQQQAQKRFASLVQQLQDLTFQNPDSLTAAANTLHLEIQNSEWLARNNPGKGLFASPQILQAAFSDNVRTGNNSDVLYPDAHTALVFRAKEYQAAQAIPLAQVEAKIKTLLAQQASQQQAQTVAEKIAQELNDGKTLTQVSAEYGLQWQTVKNVARHDPKQKFNPLILQAAFNAPRPLGDKPFSAVTTLLPGEAFVVVALNAVHDNSKLVPLPAEERIYQTQLQNYFGEFSLAEILNYYRQKADVKIYKPQLAET